MPGFAAYEKAIELLHKVSTPNGFTAAPAAEDNYCRIWTRDSVVCGLAAILTGDDLLIEAFKQSLKIIWEHQHTTGFLPSNVDAINHSVSYGGTVGRVDTAAWAIIGLCMYANHSNDIDFAQQYSVQVQKAFDLMDAWEFNGKDLMYVPQSADWADEYIQHGYILFDQLLRLWALQLAGDFFKNELYQQKAAAIKKSISNNFFYREENAHWYAANMIQQKAAAPTTFWWLGFNPSQIYPQFDLQANALVLLMNIGSNEQNNTCIGYINKLSAARDSMVPSFWPAIQNNDWQMNELKNNFAYRFRNLPGQFHNGGLWPVWNGFMCAALKVHKADKTMELLKGHLIESVSKNNFEMNECYDAETKAACGVKQCAWSAAGIILAEKGHLLFT